MGYTPEIHKEAANLHGYQGDERNQKAHIIIPRSQVGGSSNDVGFEKSEKGYTLHASEFDRKWRTGERIKTLKKTYAENKITKYVRNTSKYSILSRKKNTDGKIEIQLRIN